MHPPPIEQILISSEKKIAKLQQANSAWLLQIECSLSQSQHKVECFCGDVQNFLIRPQDLTGWQATPLSKQWENLETLEQVQAKLDSALFETLRLQQGFGTILAWHRGQNGRYGFQFLPSILHGSKPYRF